MPQVRLSRFGGDPPGAPCVLGRSPDDERPERIGSYLYERDHTRDPPSLTTRRRADRRQLRARRDGDPRARPRPGAGPQPVHVGRPVHARADERRASPTLPPFEVGEAMDGGAVGEVVASQRRRFARGRPRPAPGRLARVRGRRPGPASTVDPAIAPISTALGVLGMPGLTAYVGLLDIARDSSEGDVVFVSAPPGAVGALAGQIAKLRGRRVIGSAGSAEKVACADRRARLRRRVQLPRRRRSPSCCARPRRTGIDVYFDNVGGDHLEAAIGAHATARPHRALRRDRRATTRPSRRPARATSAR